MALGPNLLTGGNFEASTGTGLASVLVGPQSDYTACGPNIFNTPCGQNRFALFTGSAGSVTGNHVRAVPIIARGQRSFAANVSNVLTSRIVYWDAVPLINGATYRVQFAYAIINTPGPNIALRIGGAMVLALNVPSGSVPFSQWRTLRGEFVWTGATGLHTVGLTSNDPTAGGNDHVFDDFALRMVTSERECGCQRPVSCQELGAPDWFAPFPPVDPDWQYSNDSGGVWAQAATSAAHGAGATAPETLRWRHIFTIPNGYRGQWRIGISGDKADPSGQTGAGRFYMDGFLIDSNTEPGTAVHWGPFINVSPGAHIFEWREPGYTVAGNTAPVFAADYSRIGCLPGF